MSVGAEQSIKDELSLFLYLIINLCGSFDLSRLERDLPVLGSATSTHATGDSSSSAADPADLEGGKRAKAPVDTQSVLNTSTTAVNPVASNTTTAVDDWSYLCQDELIAHLSEAEKNLREFDYASLVTVSWVFITNYVHIYITDRIMNFKSFPKN